MLLVDREQTKQGVDPDSAERDLSVWRLALVIGRKAEVRHDLVGFIQLVLKMLRTQLRRSQEHEIIQQECNDADAFVLEDPS